MFYTIPVRSAKWKQKPPIMHLFYECPFTLLFWENFENFWFVLSGKREKFTLQDVCISKLEKCELLNYLITYKIAYMAKSKTK